MLDGYLKQNLHCCFQKALQHDLTNPTKMECYMQVSLAIFSEMSPIRFACVQHEPKVKPKSVP